MAEREIFPNGSEKLRFDVKATTDPTGYTVAFNFVSGATRTAPAADDGDWTAGTWGTWTDGSPHGSAPAYSPLVGSSDATPAATVAVTAGTSYRVWCRISTGSEALVFDLGDWVAV